MLVLECEFHARRETHSGNRSSGQGKWVANNVAHVYAFSAVRVPAVFHFGVVERWGVVERSSVRLHQGRESPRERALSRRLFKGPCVSDGPTGVWAVQLTHTFHQEHKMTTSGQCVMCRGPVRGWQCNTLFCDGKCDVTK